MRFLAANGGCLALPTPLDGGFWKGAFLVAIGLFYLSTVRASASDDDQFQDQTMQQRCHMFSNGNKDRQEFYSPYFPNQYPKNIDCSLVLTAPQHGYQVEVDFRDYFKLEDHSECQHDFLEIRDGPYGYSDQIGKFCGSQKFPPLIKSKDRSLWLRFKSDENIQYDGFRAVYRYIKSPTMHPRGTLCEFQKTGEQGSLEYAEIPNERLNLSFSAGIPLDCVWVVEVQPYQKIYLTFEEFKLAHPNECETNYIDIYDGARDYTSRIKHFCGAVADTVETNGTLLYFRYFGQNYFNATTFKAWFTAFREKRGNLTCSPKEYDCQDTRCIHESLLCNGIKNCRHEYDEENCDLESEKKFDISSKHIIVILTLGCGLLTSMCCAMCINCVRKLVRDGRQIHENIRRSREQLEERRSASLASSPRATRRTPITPEGGPCFIEAKANGHTCIHTEEEDTEELEDDEEDEEGDDMEDDLEETCVEMRDCECQTRDSLIIQRETGIHGTPPPPPPPTRRPPGAPPMSPLVVPTPPPPPGAHYGHPPHPPKEAYNVHPYQHHPGYPSVSPDPYERDVSSDSMRERYRAEAVIQMRDRGRYEPSKTEKSKPDVLVTH